MNRIEHTMIDASEAALEALRKHVSNPEAPGSAIRVYLSGFG